ncbi:MAG: threonine/serine exporter family protein [Lachnospiraceae bacterium]|nr:threonine/serine exporter family protein [Lachnospiraceae bacterium]
MILQFIVCFFATLSFAVLFSAPKRELIFCGLTGAAGWMVYLLLIDANAGLAVANLGASFTLTLISRIFAAMKRHPVTVYLLAGIFPLVPGAGIYYTSYYFIMHEMEQFAAKGAETLIVAGSIVFGIVFGFSLPQNIFNALPRIPQKTH